jgi:hypothetical protein
MKTQIKRSINKLGFVFLMLMSTFILGCGCNTSKPIPDPLAGFHASSLGNLDSNKAITDDYKTYIRTLSPEEQKYAGPILFYEDGTGQHAVRIEIGLNGVWWEHVLFYDKNNKRVKTMKYSNGGYQS